MRSGVPQGYAESPVLFVIYITDFYEGVGNYILKFDDDTKHFSQVSTYQNVDNINKIDMSTLNELNNGKVNAIRC